MGAVVGTDYVSAYTGDQIDAALGKAASYPAASAGTTGQVPTKTENGIEWATPSASSADTEFSVTLSAVSWSSKVQTVSNALFVASGYSYVVSPESTSYVAYASAQVYAEDVSTDDSMVFHCVGDQPSGDLTVNILRVGVQ